MAWSEEYWDAVERYYYWNPIVLGCIRKKELCKECAKRGPMEEYRSPERVVGSLKRYEDTLNHILNIFLQISPISLTNRLFAPALSDELDEDLRVLGGNFVERYEREETDLPIDNITQPDTLFTGDNSIWAIELKTGSKSSVGQLLKYALLFALEEELQGSAQSIQLSFLGERDFPHLWKEKFKSPEAVIAAAIEADPLVELKPEVAKFFNSKRDQVMSVLERLKIGSLNYGDLGNAIRRERNSLGNDEGQLALSNLFDGMIVELDRRGYI